MNSPERKDISVPASSIPRTLALHGGDREAVAKQVGVAVLFLDVLLARLGVDAGDVPDECYADAVALLLETQAEHTFGLMERMGGGDAARVDH